MEVRNVCDFVRVSPVVVVVKKRVMVVVVAGVVFCQHESVCCDGSDGCSGGS